MDILEAIILGIIQGLTEFLPVSSSGHLEIVRAIFGDNYLPKENLTFTVILHAATALSTIVVFRQEIYDIFIGVLKFKNNKEIEFSKKIILSMLPAVFLGLLFEKQIELFFKTNLLLVGIMLLITALLLLLADKSKKTNKKVSYKDSFIIGISQAIAILPGISRSGATISTSVILGVDREKSAKFSFLMVIPLIFGKVFKDFMEGEIFLKNSEALPMFLGFIAAFVSGLLACSWMISLVKKSKLSFFSIYCTLVGLIAIVFTIIN